MALSHEPDCLHVYQLHLLPEYQGKGIGELAMQALLADADRLHVPIRLRVMKVNPRARSFYERLGFTLVGDTETHDLMERVPVGAVTM